MNKMSDEKFKQLPQLFRKVQESLSTHKKCCSILKNIYLESDLNEFVTELMRYLRRFFVDDGYPNNPYINKGLNFIVNFCISIDNTYNNDLDATCPLLVEIINAVIKLHDVGNLRFRVCLFINILLREMGETESNLDEAICQKIRDAMLIRMEDIKPAVRYQAIEVLQRLQNPQDPNDMIIRSYIQNLPDNSPQVRRAIVQCIALNMATIPLVLGRCMDTDASVRYVSYEKFSKTPIRALKVEHRQRILKNGFKDQNMKVRHFVEKTLLPQWFKSCEENYYKLIRALKLDADENDFQQTIEIIERVLDIFFKTHQLTNLMEALTLGSDKLITSGEINWEEFIYWRCLVQYLRLKETGQQEHEFVDQILPELSFFSKYLKKVYMTRSECKNDWELMHHDYIMLELLEICKGYDFSDEVGRRCLYKVISNIIIEAKLSFKNVLLLTEVFEHLCEGIESFAKEICAMVSEIREPLTVPHLSEDMIRKKEVKCAEIRIKIDIAMDEQEKAIEKKEFMRAQELKMQMVELRNQLNQINQEFDGHLVEERVVKNDVHTLSKCLDLLTALMMSRNIQSIPEALEPMYDEFVQPLLISNNANIFSRAIKLTGYCASVNEELARKSIHLFTGPILAHKYMPIYDDETTMVAIDCLNDMIMLYGSDILERNRNGATDEDAATNTSKRGSKKRTLFTESQLIEDTIVNSQAPPTATLEVIIETLADLMDDDMPEIRFKSGESIVKLICTASIRSSMLLTKLLLKWFNPTTVKDQRLRQLIGQLFIDYTHQVPSSLEMIEQSYIPTLQAIMDAPLNSPLADIDIDSVLGFMSMLSKPGNHQYNVGLDSHKNIALTLCREICDRPNNKMTSVYLRGLLHLTVPSQDEVAIADLRKQVDLMFELVTDKQCHKYLVKYKSMLEGFDNDNDDNDDEDDDNDDNNEQAVVTTTTAATTTTTNHVFTRPSLNTLNNNSTIDDLANTITNAVIQETPVKRSAINTNENDPKVANTAQKSISNSSVSVKRKKRRSSRLNNNINEAEISSPATLITTATTTTYTTTNNTTKDKLRDSNESDNNTTSPKVVVTETDSDTGRINKQSRTAVRRSMRNRKRK